MVILLSFFWGKLNNPTTVIAPVTGVAFLFGLIEGIKVTSFKDSLPLMIQNLPLNEQNLAWVIPSLIVLIICVVIDKVKK